MNMALVVPYSLLVLGRAQMPASHVLSQIVSSITRSTGNLADSTCTYSKGCGSAIIRGDRILSGRLLCIYDNARRASKDYYLTSLGASEHSGIPWSGIC
jgi:hypothetical protein